MWSVLCSTHRSLVARTCKLDTTERIYAFSDNLKGNKTCSHRHKCFYILRGKSLSEGSVIVANRGAVFSKKSAIRKVCFTTGVQRAFGLRSWCQDTLLVVCFMVRGRLPLSNDSQGNVLLYKFGRAKAWLAGNRVPSLSLCPKSLHNKEDQFKERKCSMVLGLVFGSASQDIFLDARTFSAEKEGGSSRKVVLCHFGWSLQVARTAEAGIDSLRERVGSTWEKERDRERERDQRDKQTWGTSGHLHYKYRLLFSWLHNWLHI